MVFITATEMKLGGQVLGTVWVYNPPGDDLGHFTSKPSLHLLMQCDRTLLLHMFSQYLREVAILLMLSRPVSQHHEAKTPRWPWAPSWILIWSLLLPRGLEFRVPSSAQLGTLPELSDVLSILSPLEGVIAGPACLHII